MVILASYGVSAKLFKLGANIRRNVSFPDKHCQPSLAHQFRQFSAVRRDPPRLVLAEQLSCRAATGFALKINVAQCLTVGVPHDETVRRDFGSPAAGSGELLTCALFIPPDQKEEGGPPMTGHGLAIRSSSWSRWKWSVAVSAAVPCGISPDAAATITINAMLFSVSG